MSDLARFQGTLKIAPASSATDNSGNPQIASDLLETQTVNYKSENTFLLTSDSPVSVPIPGLPAVTLMMIKAVEAGVTVTVTSPVGTSQLLPSNYIFLLCQDNPITAISITRKPATNTTVRIVLASV